MLVNCRGVVQEGVNPACISRKSIFDHLSATATTLQACIVDGSHNVQIHKQYHCQSQISHLYHAIALPRENQNWRNSISRSIISTFRARNPQPAVGESGAHAPFRS